jgi:hypothetical protein
MMMAAFADFTAEILGIELAHREIAALAILIGYEEPTSDKDETTKRVWKWTNARKNSKELLAALRQLTGRSPPPTATTSPMETTLDAEDTMKSSGPSSEVPLPAPPESPFGDMQA